MRILLIEDDAMIGKAVQKGLAIAGFTVDWVIDGRAGELALGNGVYDLAILDLGLPKKDGMSLLAALRSAGDSTPILIASARDTVADRISGLETGADDYLLKPFDLGELQARLRALVRRASGQVETVITHGALRLDPLDHSVQFEGRPVELSAREFAVLQELLRHPGRVLAKASLEEKIYGWGDEIDSNAIEVYVHHLRRKLDHKLIRTVRGVGYMLAKAAP